MDTSGQTVVADERIDEMTEAGIKRQYAYHKPSDDAFSRISQLRKCFSDADDLIKKLCPHSRERAVAITELETSAMWAIKSVVLLDPDSKPEA